jgi:hypothetical protein
MIDRLRELDSAATPAPWEVGTGHQSNVIREPIGIDSVGLTGRRLDMPPIFTGQTASRNRTRWEADAALIAEARNALPNLLAVAEAARDVMAEWDKLGPTGTMDTVTAHKGLRASLEALDNR